MTMTANHDPNQQTMDLPHMRARHRGDRTVKAPGKTSPDRLANPELVSEVLDRMVLSDRWQTYLNGKSATYVRDSILPQMEALGVAFGSVRLRDIIQPDAREFLCGKRAPIKQTRHDGKPIAHRATLWAFFIRFARDLGVITRAKANSLYKATGYSRNLGRVRFSDLHAVVAADHQPFVDAPPEPTVVATPPDAKAGIRSQLRGVRAQAMAMREQMDAMIEQIDAIAGQVLGGGE